MIEILEYAKAGSNKRHALVQFENKEELDFFLLLLESKRNIIRQNASNLMIELEGE